MEEKLKELFSQVLELPDEKIENGLEYNSISSWDSVGHMALIAAIDDAFNIMLDTEDIIQMNSFKKAKEIVSKYTQSPVI